MGSKKSLPTPEQGSFFDKLQQGVSYMRNCPLCDESYTEQGVDVLFEQAGVHLVHITCEVCSGKVLTIVTLSSIGMTSVGLFTDLHPDDVVRCYDKEPISEDDVLHFHHILNKQSQPFSSLLQSQK